MLFFLLLEIYFSVSLQKYLHKYMTIRKIKLILYLAKFGGDKGQVWYLE
jgi:hypothetical protein